MELLQELEPRQVKLNNFLETTRLAEVQAELCIAENEYAEVLLDFYLDICDLPSKVLISVQDWLVSLIDEYGLPWGSESLKALLHESIAESI